MKVVVTGNCQARPLASILATIPQVEITDVIILHLARDDQEEAHQKAILSADIILAQHTDESFAPSHLRSSILKSGGKALIWPNIFFSGQQPFLRYVTSPRYDRLKGPLDVYHDLRIIKRWYIDRIGNFPFGEEYDSSYAERVAHLSLQELARRDRACDVSVTEEIHLNWRDRRIFFTFNHPSIYILHHLAGNIAYKLGLSCLEKPILAQEPLDKIIPPSIFDEERIFESSFKGVTCSGRTANTDYSFEALVKASFDAYDEQREFLLSNDIRLTPNYN